MRTANPAFWKQTSSTVPIYKADFRILCLVLLGLSFTLAGCGGGGGTAGGPAPIIDFSKKRSAVNPSQVVPLFQDRATEGSVNPGDFDFLEVDSPSMVDDGARPADRCMLFYEATNGSGINSIGLITSAEYDDFSTPVIDRDQVLVATDLPQVEFSQTGLFEDAIAVSDPSVIVDKSVPFNTTGRYRMWVEGIYSSAGTLSAILTTSSADGQNWGPPELCLGLELGPEFGDVIRIVDADVVRVDEPGETYRMIFEVVRTDLSSVLGMATTTDSNGVTWTVTDGVFTGTAAGPVFSGGPGDFDDGSVRSPGLGIERDEITDAIVEWHLFYEGKPTGFQNNNDSLIGYSNSVDGFSWSGYAVPVITATSDLIQIGAFDSDDVKHPDIFMRIPDPPSGDPLNPADLHRFVLYYSGDSAADDPNEVNRIGLGTAE
jgi:hypothetical protein